jgi:hypothetical protein
VDAMIFDKSAATSLSLFLGASHFTLFAVIVFPSGILHYFLLIERLLMNRYPALAAKSSLYEDG